MYDALGSAFAGARVAYPRLALISFMGYAIGHNVGLNTLSGGAIRYRAYSALGLSAKQIATVVAFGTLTFCLGAAALLGLSLLSEAATVGLGAAFAPLADRRWPAACCSRACSPICMLACSRHEPLRWRKIVIPVPSPSIAFAQIAVACGDLLCAAGVLYVLLPPQAAHRLRAFAGLFIIAIAAGIISNVPGGVGVFESVLLLLFRSVPADQLLGALLAYRIIYYLAPFAVALALLGAHELWAHRGPMVRIGAARTHLAQRGHAAGERASRCSAPAPCCCFPARRPGVGNRLDGAAPLRAAADPRAVASARQRGRRRPAGARATACTAGSMPPGI